jgi:hypothetical protein
MSDVSAAQAQWADNGQGFWQLEAWTKSPQQIQDEAKAMNAAGFASANSGAGKHSNPPHPPNQTRLL